MMGAIRMLFYAVLGSLKRLASCLAAQPLFFCIVSFVVILIAALVLVFNICMVKLFTVPGAIVANVVIVWLLLRLVVRILVFPGSLILWRRNTEGMYRVEMSKQFAAHLEQLRDFLYAVVKSPQRQHTSTVEGAYLGCMVIEGLSRNFRAQQRDQVKFTTEQVRVKVLVQSIEQWIVDAKVCDKRARNGAAGSATDPGKLMDWLQGMSQSVVPVPLSYALASMDLSKQAETDAGGTLDNVEQLLDIFTKLQMTQEGCCANGLRFLREPTVGSLHQLRAELQMRYNGQHHWLRTASGRKLDAMLISCKKREEGVEESDPGSIIVWCNANAAYYETMAYESQWLDFYLAQGCSVFIFNYSGFGRSQGRPSPKSFASDGRAAVDFLRRRGYTQIGVHGRSIGGIAACSLATMFPDVIKILIADRTFSTLAKAAECTFGNWAVHGLALSATWADNLTGYYQARCYKIAMCDPKDATIPDVAALRTAVALEYLKNVAPASQLSISDDCVSALVNAWAFFDMLLSLSDREGSGGECPSCPNCRDSASPETRRQARQPVVGKPQPEEDLSLDANDGEDDRQRLVAPSNAGKGGAKAEITIRWLLEHVEEAKSAVTPFIDTIRLAVDALGTGLNASGLAFEEALNRGSPSEACQAVRCFLANLQVWGSVGSLRENLKPAIDRDLELFLARGISHLEDESADVAQRLARVAVTLTPERLSEYHQRVSQARVAQVRRDVRLHMASLRRHMEAMGNSEDYVLGFDICAAALSHLREVETFTTAIYRFFKCIELTTKPPSAAAPVPDLLGDSQELAQVPPPPVFGGEAANAEASDDSEEGHSRQSGTSASVNRGVDRSAVGYVVTLNCGHNGSLSDGEVQHLICHLRAARFGKWAAPSV
eukprot:TRINITY_DN2908_c0_g1_i1.p1 TRINITY_DN2908_c0_g1~~TRINITY_DN2908_c0_g1_i1.p1  ORF type:complete len:887 (-),score=171.56 TRINITY_DN2908_c0_g1_i1:195-2855(-)